MKLRNPEIDYLSRERWTELYWGPTSGYPSVAALAAQLGVGPETVMRRLRKFGIVTRTMSEQLKADIKMGRRKSSHPGPRPMEHLVAYWTGRKQSRQHRQRIKDAKAVHPVDVPCAWCGVAVPRITAERKRRSFSACSPAHRSAYAWHLRRGENAPRPLIADHLHKLCQERLKRLRERNSDGTLRPPTWEQLEKLAEEIGAKDLEIWAVLEREGGSCAESKEIDPDAAPAWALR